MITVQVNDKKFLIKSEISILEACKSIGITIPRFCYHETLSIAGNCRMCLVEVEGVEKPVASCLTEISEGASIYTDSPFVKKARENVLETLLLNHPLDCPICDQGGECDLQDQSKTFGSDYSRYFFNKRSVEDKNCGPLIKTIMTRCIHCTRCVRFSSEIAGLDYFGTLNRGSSTEIGSYISKFFNSEISGNVIDLCPVGALTSKSYAYIARPWEIKARETIDLTDSTGSHIYVCFKDSKILRIVPKGNDNINGYLISDKSRFSFDSNVNNRIETPFIYEKKSDSLKKTNWTSFLASSKVSEFKNERTVVLVNDDIDYRIFDFLKKLGCYYKNFLIKSLITTTEINNFYLYGLTDNIKKISESNSNVGFLLSVNPKLECSVVNSRIRTKYLNSAFALVSLNQSFSFNIPTKFINLNSSESIKIFEGRYSYFSKLCSQSEQPLLIIGNSFSKRISDFINFLKYLKFNFNTINILKITGNTGLESLFFANVTPFTNKDKNLANKLIAVNLDDTFNIRKNLISLCDKILWFNTHKSVFTTKVKFIAPISSEFEEERILLNLEQRPQKTQRIVHGSFFVRNIGVIFRAMFSLNKNWNPSFHNNFLLEIVKNGFLFNNLKKIYTKIFFVTKKKYEKIKYLYDYPAKSSIEDFYSSNKNSKNSLVMLRSSQFSRNANFNF